LPGESAADVAERAAGALADWLAEHHEDTAALIVEPLVQCAAGMALHDPVYLRRARELCDRYQVHLVLDEIAVGFGRTGTLFAHEQSGIRPDFLCLSKGLTGGTLPLSVVLTTDEVYAAFYDDQVARGFLHSHSYTGNPLACRAALATLDLFGQTDVLRHNVGTGERLASQFAPLSTHPRVRHARRQGMIFAWDVVSSLPDFARRYARHALDQGLLLRPIGHTLYAMPPYVIDEAEGAFLAAGALAALQATLAEEEPSSALVLEGMCDGV
jgi:adenosylmethionine-8-amino-7-oxononanoate aminotransferase